MSPKYTRTSAATGRIAQKELKDIRDEIERVIFDFEHTGNPERLIELQKQEQDWAETYCLFEWTDVMQAAWEVCHPKWDVSQFDSGLKALFAQLQEQRLAIDPELCFAMLCWLEAEWDRAGGTDFATDRSRFIVDDTYFPSTIIRSKDIERMKKLNAYTHSAGEGFYVY